MLFDDARGNKVTAASAAAAAHLDETVRAYLGFRGDTGDRLTAALAADPDCAMAHCLRGYFMMLFGQRAMVPRARRSLEAAEPAAQAAGGRNGRQRIWPRWLSGWRAISPARRRAGRRLAAQYPRDLLALKLAQYGFFYAGESERMRDVVARALTHWDAGEPGLRVRARLSCVRARGDRGVCGGRARRTRRRRAQPGRHLGRARGLPRLRDGRPAAGRRRLGRAVSKRIGAAATISPITRCGTAACFCWSWAPPTACSTSMIATCGRNRPTICSTFRMRSRCCGGSNRRGVDVGDRWQELAERSQAHHDDHLLIFGDVHYRHGAGRGRPGRQRVADDRQPVALCRGERREPGRGRARARPRPGPRGAGATAAAITAAPATNCWRCGPAIRRLGGSHAQRDLFEEMLIDAAIRAGRSEAARALLAERLRERPRNAWSRRHYAQVLEQPGG